MSVDRQTHELLKFRLRSVGSSLADVANSLGISKSTVTVVCQGRRRSHRVQAAIAERLGTTPQQLFPDRYPTKEKDMP